MIPKTIDIENIVSALCKSKTKYNITNVINSNETLQIESDDKSI